MGMGATLPCVLFLSACNSLFYAPDQVDRSPRLAPGNSPKDVWLSSTSGTKLHAWEFPPQGGADLGTVVHFHGNGQNMSAHAWFSLWLVRKGYRLVTFDYQGYGRSEGTPSRTRTREDGALVLDWVRKEHAMRPIHVLGQSLGGAVAISSLRALSPWAPQTVVVESTFASYRGMAKEKLGQFWLTWPFQHVLKYLVSNDDSPVDAGPLGAPLLAFHAEDDLVVPLCEGRLLWESLEVPAGKLWVQAPTGGHTPFFVTPSSPYRAALLEFFDNGKGTLRQKAFVTPLPADTRVLAKENGVL